MYVVIGGEGQPSTLVWVSSDGINQATLVAAPDTGATPSPSPVDRPERRPGQGDSETDQEALTGRAP